MPSNSQPATGCYVEANLFNFDNRHDAEWTAEAVYSKPQKRVQGILVVARYTPDYVKHMVIQSDNDTGYATVEPDTIVVLKEPTGPVDFTRIFGQKQAPRHVTLL